MQRVAQRLEQGGILPPLSLPEAAQAFFAALLRRRFPRRPIVVICESLRAQEILHQDLSTWLNQLGGSPDKSPATRRHDGGSSAGGPSGNGIWFYPDWEILPGDSRLPHVDVISERLETLIALGEAAGGGEEPAPLVVTNVLAVLQRTFAPEDLRRMTRRVERGSRVDPLELIEWLESLGYEPEAKVTQKGEICLRGGILDVYPPTSPWPVRLEFFGDELESLRHFDPASQTSREEIAAAVLSPAGELGLLKQAQARGGEPSLRMATLLEHLPSEALLVVCGPEEVAARATEYRRAGPVTDPFFITWEDFSGGARQRGLAVVELEESPLSGAAPVPGPDAHDGQGPGRADANPRAVAEPPMAGAAAESPEAAGERVPGEGGMAGHVAALELGFESLDAFRALTERPPEPQIAEVQRREFFAQLHRWLRQGYEVQVFFNNDGERERFQEIWLEYGLDEGPAGEEPAGARPALHTAIGMLSRGFLHPEARWVVVTDAEVFGRYKVQRPRRLKSPHAQALRSALDIDFTDLQEGDYVVHLQHGIGRYLGLRVLPAGAGTKPTDRAPAGGSSGQECLVIEYAPADRSQPAPKLYVPVTEAHLVSKYVGAGKARPPLNSLGGTRWAKAKAQAERAVRDVASELLCIQAARASQPGHAFAADTAWQREFEAAFIYEETPDQLRAIQETKRDMERPRPMDRLICGDVGFGKTEVGIRAAFKAVMDGRQVAVLVPTTVLAQQHFNTFRERMADYPVRIELLSRFRTRRAQQRVVRDLALGAVDIVIGTHRLLQDDIAFKDLGLVIIDEEQRFGVLHKERFKQLRRLVDVLTLSATPIPRTLYLALTGARDMSTIQTPPHDRLPVETIVAQYDERLIRDAIQRELNRGGQVFFLHNRVMTIQLVAQKLAALVPQARIAVGHGQMRSDELEEVMTRFVNGEADILLSTTIIESGLDIPNANTIIIDRADRFGLSDLYQLRGRVGRYKHQAYAYLLLPRHGTLVADVRKRLSAMKQYSTLGSGFKIAMRDLEIRGAGNLLGAEQSGHITAVGFDLYCELLKKSIAALKGERLKPRVEVQVRLDFLSLNPPEPGPAPGRPDRPDRPAGLGEEPELPAAEPPRVEADSGRGEPGGPAAAFLPFTYIADARQRIEIYRKLAELTDKAGVIALESELRDRFGPPPPAVELLLQLTDLKILAADRGITAIEVKDDKLMLTRHGEYLMVGNKFPRLTKKTARARLKEIRRLLATL